MRASPNPTEIRRDVQRPTLASLEWASTLYLATVMSFSLCKKPTTFEAVKKRQYFWSDNNITPSAAAPLPTATKAVLESTLRTSTVPHLEKDQVKYSLQD